MCVLLEINLHELVYVLVLNLVEISHDLAERHIVHMVAEPHLGLDLVTVCNCHIVHLVAETQNPHIL